MIDELRHFETLSGYDYLHINRDTTPAYVVKRFLLSYASEAVIDQLPLLDDLGMLIHTMNKDEAHNADVTAPYYRDKVKEFVSTAKDTVLDADWNMLLAERLYGAAVRVGTPEQFMTFWTVSQRRLAEKYSSFMIWGVGGRYQDFFAPFVKSGEFSMNFLGFVDSNEAVVGTEIDGHRVHHPDEISAIKPDLILSATTFFGQISKQAKALCPGVDLLQYNF